MSSERRTTRAIIETKRLSVFEDTIELGANTHKRLRVTHPGAVAILALSANAEIVLVDQYRRSLGKRILEIPAGTLEPGEDLLVAAKRELKEETGYSAKSWQSLGELCPAPGFCDERQFLFLASDLTPGRSDLDETENIVCKSVPLEEFRKLVKSLDIYDSKTLAAAYRAEILGLLAE